MRHVRPSWVHIRVGELIVLAATSTIAAGWQPNYASAPLTVQYFHDLDRNREQYQRATDILKAVAISSGDWVADVGAGNGYYAQRITDLVGPTGKVFAEDISDYAVNFLNQRVKLFDLRNVAVVKGDLDNPKLPADSLAAVLVVDSYHHFSQYKPMSEHLLRALKPGGRLVIADYSLPDHRSRSRADQLKVHEIDPVLVRIEVERVGFQVLKCEDPFLKRMPEVKDGSIGRADLWLMIAVRPTVQASQVAFYLSAPEPSPALMY
jgi:ubiquinone/menaquinone biosynthesis C-methylase UbiE